KIRKMDDLKEDIHELKEVLSGIPERVTKVEEAVTHNNKRIQRLEANINRKRLRISGLNEENERNFLDLKPKLERMFKDGLNIQSDIVLEDAFRVGKKGDNPRVVIVSFEKLGDRQRVWSERKLLTKNDN